MYLLDTDVLLELRKAPTGQAHANVILWAESVASQSLSISIITVLEIEKSILKLEQQSADQASDLRFWLDDHVLPAFHDRILAFDVPIAKHCAQLQRLNPCSERDAIILATALVHELTLVSRSTENFNLLGLKLINPWEG